MREDNSRDATVRGRSSPASAPELSALAQRLAATYGVQARPIRLDLSQPPTIAALENARELETNCRAPLALISTFAPRLVARGRGGIVLISSLAGMQGSPFIAHYAATKAYNTVLAEGLWAELAPSGVDVLACCAGAIATYGYSQNAPSRTSRFAPAPLSPETVVREALDALGQKPTHVPGSANRFGQFLLQRLLPRKVAIRLMQSNTRSLASAAPE